MDIPAMFRGAVAEFDARVRQVGDHQWQAATPDEDWAVRDLVNHVAGEDLWAPPLLAGSTIAEVGDRFDGDVLGADPRAAWTAASAGAVRAVGERGVMDRIVHLSFGDFPGREYALQLFADHLIHAWDLARADERLDAGLVASCATWFEAAEDAYRSAGAILFNNIGNLCQHARRYGESLKHYRNALSIYRDIGDRRCEADALNNIGGAYHRAGHHGDALSQHQKALVIAHELADLYQEARSHCSIGDVHLATRNYTSALDDYRSALELSHGIGDVYQEALAHDGLGSVLLHAEGAAAARKHWRTALDLFERIGVPEADVVRGRLRTIGATAS